MGLGVFVARRLGLSGFTLPEIAVRSHRRTRLDDLRIDDRGRMAGTRPAMTKRNGSGQGGKALKPCSATAADVGAA
jgi:hypothetical protein